jgi:hypothetical protein
METISGRLRLRGLMIANIQGLLIAAGLNLRRYLAASGWGRRHAPCGSLLALPREPGWLSAVSGIGTAHASVVDTDRVTLLTHKSVMVPTIRS